MTLFSSLRSRSNYFLLLTLAGFNFMIYFYYGVATQGHIACLLWTRRPSDSPPEVMILNLSSDGFGSKYFDPDWVTSIFFVAWVGSG